RRRHTRSYGDWSSDVCSSDLFLLAVLISALWIASLSLMFSTFLPPLLTTICTGLGVALTLLGLHSLNPAWALLAPTSSIFLALRSEERRVGKECSSKMACCAG